MDLITTVALLHLRTHANPLSVSEKLLVKASPWLKGALLVLPETIDVQTCYSNKKSWEPFSVALRQNYRKRLAGFSAQYGIAIVAGLREAEHVNAAVLFVPKETPVVIRKKTSNEAETWVGGESEGSAATHPVSHEQTIGCLICHDCQTSAAQMGDLKPSFLAIPAASTTMSLASLVAGNILDRPWMGKSLVIFANSLMNSWIGDGKKVVAHAEGERDVILGWDISAGIEHRETLD